MGLTAGITMAGATLASSISSADAQRMQGQYQKDQADLNARLSEDRAQDAIERGRAESNIARKKTNAQVGSQRVAAAAMGLDLGEGAPAEAVAQTQNVGAVEEMNIRTNAWREAWGYKIEASNFRMEGDMAKIAGDGAAKQTLIAGGMQAIAYGAQGYAAGRNTGGGTKGSTGGYSSSMTPYGNQPRIQPVR